MANIWKMFSDLVPEPPILIGTVTSWIGDSHSVVEMPGGGTIIAKGQAVGVGGKAFVQNGEIRSEAPNLPVYEASV